MDVIIPLVVIFLFIVLLSNNKSGSSRQRSAAQPAKAQHPQTTGATKTQPPVHEPESQQETHEEFCQASGADEDENWDSESDFHEGEDPCHAETSIRIEPAETDPEVEMPSLEAQEILKGIVWSEILTRKRR